MKRDLKRDLEDWLLLIGVVAVFTVFIGAMVGALIWAYQESSDKRQCRNRGGEVVKTSVGEWRCDSQWDRLRRLP